MNLEDIPKLRKKFQEIDDRRRAVILGLPPIPRDGDVRYAIWKRDEEIRQINLAAKTETRSLCENVFGDSLSGMDLDIYPEDVLDWIEYFLKHEVVD